MHELSGLRGHGGLLGSLPQVENAAIQAYCAQRITESATAGASAAAVVADKTHIKKKRPRNRENVVTKSQRVKIAQTRRQLERCRLLDARIGLSLEPLGDAGIGVRTRAGPRLDFGRNAA
jgi:hypothetical protein